MNALAVARYGLTSLALLGLVAACSSPSSNAVPAAQVAAPAAKTPHALLYVADLGTSDVDVLTYPAGKPKAKISGFETVNGACSDSSGNVYVSDGHRNAILEFPRGAKKPSRTLTDPGYYILGCAIDKTSGDLAASIQPQSSDPGGVAIFKAAKGSAKNILSPSTYFPSFCSFDGSGNLFLDGNDTHSNVFIAELPKKSATIESVTFDQQIIIAGGVQWDGKYLAVGDQGAGYKGSTIYEFSISGTTATKVGTTMLTTSTDVSGFWLDGDRVVGPNRGSSPSVMYWKYPAGGNPVKTITGFSQPVAATVSDPQ